MVRRYADAVVRSFLHKVGRGLSPTALILAGLCFLLPFVTVACDTPGGYGRAAPGGSTTYTGVDLVVGGEPDVSAPDKVLPAGLARDDQLVPQPAGAVVLLLIVAGTGFAIRMKERRKRRASVVALAGAAATALLVNQALVEAELAVRLGNQLTAPLPEGKTLRDYIHTGPGFGFCLILLLLVAALNAIGWWRARPRPALIAGNAAGAGAAIPGYEEELIIADADDPATTAVLPDHDELAGGGR
jgi:hypothetical protein